jgi:hypothetical protein
MTPGTKTPGCFSANSAIVFPSPVKKHKDEKMIQVPMDADLIPVEVPPRCPKF